jgi:hypothetical protein
MTGDGWCGEGWFAEFVIAQGLVYFARSNPLVLFGRYPSPGPAA